MSDRKEFRELVDPEVARASIDDLDIDPGTEHVSLERARGRVLAERIDATIDVPGFDRATVDGYAVRATDVVGASEADPVHLDVVDTVHAGERPTSEVETNEAIEISTGAVLPPHADAVVMVERTREVEVGIAVESAVAPGENIMTAGADIAAGHRALGPGRRLAARDIALLAALGHEQVAVRKKPRVGVVSTGDELVRPGEELDHSRGHIFDVNSHTIVAAIAAAGGKPMLYPHVGDDADEMQQTLERAAEECDLICSSGSTSASAVDVIYRVVEERGEVIHHGVAVKPGKPMLIGRMGADHSAYIGLPGFPVSALMTFRRFVAPRIRSAAGLPPDESATMTAQMAEEARFGEGRMRLLPVGVLEDAAGSIMAYPVDKGSGATTSLADADGVVEVPANTAYVAENEEVTVHLFDSTVRPPSILAVGEADPVFADLLDEVRSPRFLPVGSIEGRRRLQRSIPDVAVLADESSATPDGVVIAEWERTWGLVVPGDNPAQIEGVEDLVDENLQFANLGVSAIRRALDERFDELAEERSVTQAELTDQIQGYGVGRPGYESAARRVAAGEADIGLGLASTADELGLRIVPCGRQRISVIVAEHRQTKTGVKELEAVIERSLSDVLEQKEGYRAPPATLQ